MTIFLLVAVGYVYLFITGRYYLRNEGFQSEEAPTNTPAKPRATVYMADQTYAPYTTRPVEMLDDYEKNLIYQNETDRELSEGLRNKLMSQYPMDWSGLPPSSTQFQAGLRETFVDAPATASAGQQQPVMGQAAAPATPYGNIGAENLTPPDTESLEKEERSLLQTYVPKKLSEMTTYDLEDVETMLKRVYDEKGLIPEIEHKEGTQVWEITGVRKKDEKIVYEEDAQPAAASTMDAPNTAAGEATIQVAPNSIQTGLGRDPFFDDSVRTRTDRWDYTQWTPGLERMFAPTYPKQEWY